MAIPLGMIVLITVIEAAVPPTIHLGPLLVVTPAIAALFAGPRATAAVSALAVAAQVVVGGLRDGVTTLDHEVHILTVVVISVLLVGFCAMRERRDRELAQVRSVSEAAQRVLLRPLPHRIGPLRIASVYLAAAPQAGIGGDLYAAARTARATRLIIGDVRGKGLASVSDAALLLCAFREAAHRHAALPALMTQLEESVCRNLAELTDTDQEAEECFVTATLLDVPDDEPAVGLIDCGHPPPLLLRRGQVITLQAAQPAPPLGLGALAEGGYELERFPFEPGDLLVLYTDGVIETRDRSGAFYPLADRLARWSGSGPEELVRCVRDDLLAHAGRPLEDDAAVIAVERMAAPSAEVTATDGEQRRAPA